MYTYYMETNEGIYDRQMAGKGFQLYKKFHHLI